MNSHRTWISLAVAVAVAVVAAGCGKSEEKKSATQVAAKVNGDEISIYQVNAVLGKLGNLPADKAAVAKREILDKLIDQQLAVQQAVEKKLDRSPNVVQAIENAKREILARAFLDQVANAQVKPTDDEARDFYNQHPELFAQRRVFNLQEILVPKSQGNPADVKAIAAGGKSMQDIANALKAKNIKFAAQAGARAAEQLPLETLPRYQALKDGETSAIEAPDGIVIVHLVNSRTMPVDQATAMPRIQQFLSNRRASEAIATEMKGIRDKAKIERLGEFKLSAEEATPPPPPPKVEPPKEPRPVVEVPRPSPRPAAPPPPKEPRSKSDVSESLIQKGVSGLK